MEPAHNPVSRKRCCSFNAIALCDIGPPRNALHRSTRFLSCTPSTTCFVVVTSRANLHSRFNSNFGVTFVYVWISRAVGRHCLDARCHGAVAGRLRRTACRRRRTPQSTEPDVSIVTVKPQARAMVRELPGRIAPTRVSDVRPRVSGIVVQRLFNQGSEVKAGDTLYKIDPRPFEVEVQSSEAALARARATLEQATQHANRIATLTSQRAAPEAEERGGDCEPASGRGRRRRPQGRRRARQAQSRLRDHPRADRRHRRRGAGQRRRAGGAERDRESRHHPAARSDLCRLHPVGDRTQSPAPRASRAANSTVFRRMR